MRYAALTDVGKKRNLNEDSYIADGAIFAVADGMGGHRAGEVASAMALDALLSGLNKRSRETFEEKLVGAIKLANQRVHEKAERDAARRGMGTTLTIAVPLDGKLYVGHVGDSRLYLLRDGKLRQLTNDHSLVAQMVESGHLKPEEAESHPQRSIITRAIGAEADVVVDVIVEDIFPEDRFLLCS
ncbi:MAG TPA: protein phosphatase 2C domain-containing protein, partial [Anaerolineae bacterium]|nr:protein phosphatase 2C domain-containing protein [Anaerolineae bacterium]